MRRLLTALILAAGLVAISACGSIVEPKVCTIETATLFSYDSQGRVTAYVCP